MNILIFSLIFCPFMPFQDTEAPTHVEEVTVTSQHREEKLQEVPLAVTVVDAQALDEAEVRTLQDLNGLVPGLVTTQSTVYSTAPLSIRGIGGANGGGNFFGDEPVATYVDGVYIGRLVFSTSDLLDVANIEVLRGPQGTLYGRNSTAGALLVKSARPTPEREGYLRMRLSDLNETRFSGAFSGPLSDRLQARLAFAASDKSDWGENDSGRDVGGSEDFSGRLFLAWKPTDSLSVDLIGEWLDRESSPATIQVGDLSNPASASPYNPRGDLDELLDNHRFTLNDPNTTQAEQSAFTVTVSWAGESVLFESITGWRTIDTSGTQDSDGVGLTLFNNDGSLDSKQWSQELRLSGSNDGPFTWLLGAYFLHEENDMYFAIRNHNGFFGLGTQAFFNADQEVDALALFADMSYAFNERFSVTLGGRYSSEDKAFNNDILVEILHGGRVPDFIPNIGGVVLPAGFVFSDPPLFSDDDDWTDFSPRVVFNGQINEHAMAYLSYSEGFKSGGYNGFGAAPGFDQEQVQAFEVGLKSELADRRVRLNLSSFLYDYSDLQVRLGVPTGGVEIANAAEAEIKGLEVELAAVPSQGLRLDVSLAWLDATFTEGTLRQVPLGVLFPMGAPIPLEEVSVAGNHLSRAPEWQAFFGASKGFELDSGALTASFAWRYQDEVFFLESAQDQPTFRSDAWSEMDVRLAYVPASKRWELALYGRNIGDERHISQITQLGSFPNGAVNEPARWGLQVTYRY